MAASSRDVWSSARRGLGLALLALCAAACSVGHGTGEIEGVVSVEGCREEGGYQLRPTAFFAEAAEQTLRLRIQRGSDIEVRSDGLAVLVQDAKQVKREYLGRPITLGPDQVPVVHVSLYLNESCPAERTKTPVALSAVSGTIRFTSIYAPQVDKDEVRIAAELTDVRFEDPRTDARWARLSGHFDFLYVRGSPAQLFP